MINEILAVVGGLSCGLVVHLLSRAAGLDTTWPGVAWAASIGTLMIYRLRVATWPS